MPIVQHIQHSTITESHSATVMTNTRRTKIRATRSASSPGTKRQSVAGPSGRNVTKRNPQTPVRRSVRRSSSPTPDKEIRSSLPNTGSVESLGDDMVRDEIEPTMDIPARQPTCSERPLSDSSSEGSMDIGTTQSLDIRKKRPSGATPLPLAKKQRMSIKGNEVLLARLKELEFKNKSQAEEILRLTHDNDRLLDKYNDLKQKKEKEAQSDKASKAAEASLANALHTTQNQVLQLQSQLSVLARSRNVRTLKDTLPAAYKAHWTILSKACPTWAMRETQELDPTNLDASVRKWTNRMKRDTDLPDGFPVVPKSPLEASAGGGVYVPSFTTSKECVTEFVSASFASNEILKSMTSESDRKVLVDFFTMYRGLGTLMKKSVSESVTSRKRLARDHLLQLLGWEDLSSRKLSVLVKSEGNLNEVQSRISDFQRKLKKMDATGSRDYTLWRKANIEDISASSGTQANAVEDDFPGDVLFADSGRVSVFRKFLGYNPNASGPTHGTIMSLARLDAWIATVVDLMDLQEKRGGRKQRLFQSKFAEHLIQCTKSILKVVGQKVRSSEDRPTVLITDVPTLKRFEVVRPDWFSEHISKELGLVMDCFIGESISESEECTSFMPVYNTVDNEWECEAGDEVRDANNVSAAEHETSNDQTE